MNDKQENQKIFIKPSELRDLGINYSNSHLLKMSRENRFPQRKYLSPYKPVYIYSEILDWVDQQTSKRGSADNA